MISDGIVKVDSFLNHRLETGLLFDMGGELARRFSKDKPDLVLTVEASGIALAMTTAHAKARTWRKKKYTASRTNASP